jgi:MFS family permease
MHFESPPPATPSNLKLPPWYKELTGYHWFVFTVAALGWLADCMDQQLFTLARNPAIRELRGTSQDLIFYGGLATMIFMLGWATGGIIFGIMGDRLGRAKTMLITILIYSLCTGLSALSRGFWDFAFYRFITGLGVGGEFAVGVALIAEVMPDRARPHALAWLQATSTIGNMAAALIGMTLSSYEAAGTFGDWQPWRIMFIIGALPAFLTIVIARNLKEPERWVAMRKIADSGGQKMGSMRELLTDPRWRKNALIGLVLATSGVVGLWGIGFFSPDLIRIVFRQRIEDEERKHPEAKATDRAFIRALVLAPDQPDALGKSQDGGTVPKRIDAAKDLKPTAFVDEESRKIFAAAMKLNADGQPVDAAAVAKILQKQDPNSTSAALTEGILSGSVNPEASVANEAEALRQRARNIDSQLTLWSSINNLLFNFGAFFGVYCFSRLTTYMGRRPAFAITFCLALAATVNTFWNLTSFWEIFWMVPLMGFCQIALFGGYAIYFPELFPTRLRSTGTSFSYNVGRYLSSPGPLLLGLLTEVFRVEGGDETMPFRYAGVTMCSFFLLGLAILPFAPETKGKPLPD